MPLLRRLCSLFSIDIQFPKLNVAGSIPGLPLHFLDQAPRRPALILVSIAARLSAFLNLYDQVRDGFSFRHNHLVRHPRVNVNDVACL
jgi:hypothetical protein